ncbi:kinase-like domain-containing protein [Cunninghamella echinulata]|nr:kinase-like domain-containing protein [Cunninghamella echinulata]
MSFNPFDQPELLLHKYIDNKSIQLLSVLGVGAYGVVYSGKHIKSNTDIAVKLISSSSSNNNNTAVYQNEINLHAKVTSHPNIVSLKKVIQEDGNIFMIMDYATCGDLFSAITKNKYNIVGHNHTIKKIFIQILEAVQHCHQKGVSHRDLKPENILLFDQLKVKLADFGLATTQAVSADLGCGSTFYFSPECQTGVVRNNKTTNVYGTQQNDIWSLGIILINLVTGRNPWRQAHMEDHTFAAYTQQPKTFFTTILPTISTEMDDILQRIFCLDPSHRISLPELKWRIMECKTFLCNQPPMSSALLLKKKKKNILKPSSLNIYTQCIQASSSMTQTILDYTDVFSTNNTPTSYSCSTSSSISSISSMEHTPITPTLSFLNEFYSKKLSSDALVDIIQTSALFSDF